MPRTAEGGLNSSSAAANVVAESQPILGEPMYRIAFGVLLAITGLAEGATAQSLTPDELEAMINERVNAQNPYRTLLADPDPERSLAAMQIMLESGDSDLTRMALEFGLLSPNPTVRRIAVEAFMATGPVLSIRFDGTETDGDGFVNLIRGTLTGTLDEDGIGYARAAVGPLSEDGTCFVDMVRGKCLVTINSDGVFLSIYLTWNQPYVSARMVVNDSGQLEGVASLYNVSEPIPVTIQLVD